MLDVGDDQICYIVSKNKYKNRETINTVFKKVLCSRRYCILKAIVFCKALYSGQHCAQECIAIKKVLHSRKYCIQECIVFSKILQKKT